MRVYVTLTMALVALLLSPGAGEARRWNAGLELSISHDRASTTSLTLAGSGMESRLSVGRTLDRAPRFSIVGGLVLRTAAVSLSNSKDLSLHPDATLLFAHCALGLRYQLRPRWTLGASAGPVLMALATPRVFGVSQVGAATSLAASRTLLSGRSSLKAVARLSAAVTPDHAQTYWGTTMSLGLQGAFGW